MSSLDDPELLSHLADPANATLLDDLRTEVKLAHIRRSRHPNEALRAVNDYLARHRWNTLCTRVVVYDNRKKRAAWCRFVCKRILSKRSGMLDAILDLLDIAGAQEEDFIDAMYEMFQSKAHAKDDSSGSDTLEDKEYMLCRRLIKKFVSKAAEGMTWTGNIDDHLDDELEDGSDDDYRPIWANTSSSESTTLSTSKDQQISRSESDMSISTCSSPPTSIHELSSVSATHAFDAPASYSSVASPTGVPSNPSPLRPTPRSQVIRLLDQPYHGPDAQPILLDTVIPQLPEGKYQSIQVQDVKLTLVDKSLLNGADFRQHMSLLLIYIIFSRRYMPGKRLPLDKERVVIRLSLPDLSRLSFVGDTIWDDEVVHMVVRQTGVKDLDFTKLALDLFKTNGFAGIRQDAEGYWYGHPKIEEHGCGNVHEARCSICYETRRSALRDYLDNEYGRSVRRLRIEWNLRHFGTPIGHDTSDLIQAAIDEELPRQVQHPGTLSSLPKVALGPLPRKIRRSLQAALPGANFWEANAGRRYTLKSPWDPSSHVVLLSGSVSRYFGTVKQGGEVVPPIHEQRSYWARWAAARRATPSQLENPNDSIGRASAEAGVLPVSSAGPAAISSTKQDPARHQPQPTVEPGPSTQGSSRNVSLATRNIAPTEGARVMDSSSRTPPGLQENRSRPYKRPALQTLSNNSSNLGVQMPIIATEASVTTASGGSKNRIKASKKGKEIENTGKKGKKRHY